MLRCLTEAHRCLSIDDDRVYLMGESMGGSGAWYLASRHPDLFAAAAPVYGGRDGRVIPSLEDSLSRRQRINFEAFLQERSSTFSSLENLIDLPLYVQHGDSDQQVNVENSRYTVRMLQRWGYDVRYREHPGLGHEDLERRIWSIDAAPSA